MGRFGWGGGGEESMLTNIIFLFLSLIPWTLNIVFRKVWSLDGRSVR